MFCGLGFFGSGLKGRGIFEIQVSFAEHKSSKLDWPPGVGEGRVGTGEGAAGRIAVCSLHSACLPSQDLQHVLSCTEYFVCEQEAYKGGGGEGGGGREGCCHSLGGDQYFLLLIGLRVPAMILKSLRRRRRRPRQWRARGERRRRKTRRNR